MMARQRGGVTIGFALALGSGLLASSALKAQSPADVLRQLRCPVSGYGGELSAVRVLPEGAAQLPTGPDFIAIARRALHYLANNPVPENGYQCRFWNMLLRYPPTPLPDANKNPLDPTAVGDTESRNDIAFNQMREICGDWQYGREAQEAVHRRLVGYLRRGRGQAGDNMLWCYLYAGSPDHDGPYACPWATAKLLRSEVDLYRLTGDGSHAKLARTLFEGLRQAASWDTGRAYYPNGAQGFRPGKFARGYEGHYPHVIGPVTYYWAYLHDEAGLAFARAMAEGLLADLQPRHLHQPDGTVRGHNHVQMHALRGVAELGARSGQARYLAWVKPAYDYYRNNGFDTGWLPETREDANHNNHSEMCLVADMLEIEVWFARAGWPEYWDRVERTIRNVVVPAQFVVTPELERLWRQVHKDRRRSEVETGLKLLHDMEGGFLSALTPNDRVFEVNPHGQHHGSVSYRGQRIVLDMMGCCPPEGMRAIYLAWRETVHQSEGRVFVNLAFSRDAPQAKVISEVPRRGHLAVVAKVAADFFLRPPGWAPRSGVKARRNGEAVKVAWGGPAFAYVVFKRVRPGERLEIGWPLIEFTQRVAHKVFDGVEHSYTYHWIGNLVVGVEPQGRWLPLYTYQKQ